MKSKIKGRVYWVGSIGWEDHPEGYAHIQHYHKSNSYNSYLVLGKNNVLIDTVALEHKESYIENLSREIQIDTIHSLILTSDEDDHIGIVPYIIEKNPNLLVFISSKHYKSILNKLGNEVRLIVVRNGDSLSFEDFSIDFIETTPFNKHVSLFCYIREERILFSGYATDYIVQDLLGQSNFYQTRLKTHNSVVPIGEMLKQKLEEKIGPGFSPEIICTNHGTPMFVA